MGENNKDQLEDAIVIMETALEAVKEQKVALEQYGVQMARIMEKLKTNEAKQELAEITQENYKNMIEFEIRMVEMEKQLELMKLQSLIS